MLTIVSKRFWLPGIDDNGTVYPLLFLQTGMAVVPVSPVLLNLKGVNVGIIRLYAHKTQPRNTIHIGRKNNAVPVNGRLFIKTVFDLQGNGVTFFPAKNGPRQASIDCFGLTLTARDIDGRFTNGQVKLSTLQGCGNWQAQAGTRIETPYAKTSGYAREG
ncbi:Uncharacterised protein [Klebsiella quasipneumoniae]|nr:Uncharacterised protein [Klebsiella quasipneumoniae]